LWIEKPRNLRLEKFEIYDGLIFNLFPEIRSTFQRKTNNRKTPKHKYLINIPIDPFSSPPSSRESPAITQFYFKLKKKQKNNGKIIHKFPNQSQINLSPFHNKKYREKQ
jgi:hypothetical protein